MKVTLLLALVGALVVRAADPLNLDYRSDQLTYSGYTFEKVFDSKTEEWTLEARKGAQLVYTFGSAIKPEWLRMGLVRIVPDDTQQVMLSV